MQADPHPRDTELLITHNGDEFDEVEGSDEFVIHDQLTKLSLEDHDKVYSIISNTEIEIDTSIPVYEIAWTHILNPRKGRLLELTLFYLRLKTVVQIRQPDVLVCDNGLDPGFESAVKDIGNECDIIVDDNRKISAHFADILRFFSNSLFILPFLIDQLISIGLRYLGKLPNITPVVFIPPLKRLESMMPVLEEFQSDFDVLIVSHASAWWWSHRHSKLDEYDPRPITTWMTFSEFVDQIMTYFALSRKILFGDILRAEIEQEFEDQLGIRPSRSINYAIRNAFRTRMFTSLLLYDIFTQLVSRHRPKQVIVGTLAPEGRSVIAGSNNNDIEPYHIPHSIAAWQCPNPPSELTQFVSGKLDKLHYNQSEQVHNPWNVVVAGRPYLTDLWKSRSNRKVKHIDGETNPIRVTLATQPYDICRDFVKDVIEASAVFDKHIEFVIKIHPSEKISKYSEFEGPSVTMQEGGLHKLLEDSDVTITINSNVGLESIVLGTPCVTYNKWSPLKQPALYSQYGPVPMYRDKSTLKSFFESISSEKLSEIYENQHDFVRENYYLDTDACENIIDHLLRRNER